MRRVFSGINFPLLSLLSLILTACQSLQKPVTAIMHASNKEIRTIVNGESQPWFISPEINPDPLKVECIKEEILVSFIAESDSLSFKIHLGDTINFLVILNKKDTAHTQIIGVPKNVNFTEAYIQQHKGKFEVAVPEVHELANIVVALSKIGQLDSNMVDMCTGYHKEVLKHFEPFKNHSLMDSVNKYINKLGDNNGYLYYYALKMNACAYVFNDKQEIVNEGFIRKMGFDNPEDPFIQLAPLMADFSKKSDFRSFYKSHKNYYDSLVTMYRQLNPIDKMQQWLEKKFGFVYGNYTVYFSPLVGGAHATNRFADNHFEQNFMFVCRADPSPKLNMALNEMLESRIVFTEIDHNFVNPVSDKYREQITRVLQDRAKWVDANSQGTSMYDSPYAVFNEYMTFAVYSLYCMDNFKEKDFVDLENKMESMMAHGRGFIKFKEFNRELVKLYKKDPTLSVDAMYQKLLSWCETQ